MYYPDITLEHAGQLEFLYHLREVNKTASTCWRHHLDDYDRRLRNHLHGLLPDFDSVAGQLSQSIDPQRPSTVFAVAAAWLAHDGSWPDLVDAAVEQSSLGLWAAVDAFKLLGLRRFDGGQVTAAAVRLAATTEAPSTDALTRALESTQRPLQLAALRVAGTARISQLASLIVDLLGQDDDCLRFEAARAALLLGRLEAIDVLKGFLTEPTPRAWEASTMLGAWLDAAALRSLAGEHAKQRPSRALAARLAGYSGQPALIPGLLRMLEDSALAKLAAEALGMITGLDLVAENAVSSSPDTDVAPMVGLSLPYPDLEKVNEWWEANQRLFPTDVGPFLYGERRDSRRIAEVLTQENQHARWFAAWLTAAADPSEPLFDVAAFS